MARIYEAVLYGKVIDRDEDSNDLVRRCSDKYGYDVVMSRDFIIEAKEEVSARP